MSDTPEPARPLARTRDALQQGWAWIVVAVLAVFMFFTRMRPASRYNRGEGEAYFFGTDPYYHTRQIFHTVHNWPQALPYDPWTQYPLGTTMGTFGTLFDLLAASLAWLVGLVVDGGVPARSTLVDVVTAYPALIGALCVIPVFLLSRDLFGEAPAVFASVAAALIPGAFLMRSIAGFPDHHIMEVLFSTLAVWTSYRAVKSFEASEVGLDAMLKDPRIVWTDHRPALASALFAGLAFWALMATWPPGVLFAVIVGAWWVLDLLVRVTRDEDPGPVVAAAGAVSLFTALLILPNTLMTGRFGFAAVDFTWLQPLVPLLIGASILGLALGAQAWRARDLPLWGYHTTAGVSGLAGLGLLSLVLPELFTHLTSGASWVLGSTMGWVPGIETPHTRLTIAEAQPRSFGSFYDDFGLLAYTAVAAWLISLIDLKHEGNTRDGLLVVWGFFVLSAAMTQGRFTYFFAIAVLVLNAKLAARLFDAARAMSEPSEDARAQDRISPTTGKVVVVVLLALFLVPVNVLGFTSGDCRGDLNAWTQAGCLGPNREDRLWWEESNWLGENTPDGGVDLAATYQEPDGPFPYPGEAYGVLSWWDYGHQIQWDGNRAPIANPFQQQAPLASQIFTALPEDENRTSEQIALETLDAYLGEDAQARYVMIDDAMVTGKFGAITVWSGDEEIYRNPQEHSYQLEVEEGGTETVPLPGLPDEVGSMFLQELYRGDADGYEHHRLVRENPRYVWIGTTAQITEQGQVRLDQYNRILGQGGADDVPFPTLSYESEDQVLRAGENQLVYDVSVESSLKTYERVPGATLTGQAEPGQPVTVDVLLQVEPTEREFVYEQTVTADDEGRFRITVPYSTTDPVPVTEGGTDTQVTAQTPYRVHIGDEPIPVNVPDRAVLEGAPVPVDP